MTTKLHVDDELVQRCVAAGGKVLVERDGAVLAIRVPKAGLSAEDVRAWAARDKQSRIEAIEAGIKFVETPNPAGLLGKCEFSFTPGMDEQGVRNAMRGALYLGAERRVGKLLTHASSYVRGEASLLAKQLPVEEGRVSSDPFWIDLMRLETEALAYGVETSVTRDRKRQKGAGTGGKESGKARQEEAAGKHDEIIKAAKYELTSGRAARDIASLLARRFGYSPEQTRRVLQRAGVLKKKKLT